MPKRIIFEEGGRLKVVIPAPEFLAGGGTLEEVAAKAVPSALPYEIVDTSTIPSDRTFREAWKKGPFNVEVDMPKARLIHMDRIRAVRDKELDKTDTELLRALEDGTNFSSLKVRRQKLRDIPQTFDLETALTAEQLKNKWPLEIPRP